MWGYVVGVESDGYLVVCVFHTMTFINDCVFPANFGENGAIADDILIKQVLKKLKCVTMELIFI